MAPESTTTTLPPGEVMPAERWIPNALGAWEEIAGRIQGRRLAVFLDYDGTLVAIAPTPAQAVLTSDMRSALNVVARKWPTAVVSGRALEDIERLVGLPGVLYAGSHGFDIRGPGGLRLEVAGEGLTSIREAAAGLRALTRGIAGALVEEKRLSVALHYRQVGLTALPQLQRKFRIIVECYPDLVACEGKAVLELRPAVEWGKGQAVLWLLEELGLAGPDVVSVYIGDDVTDEHAFRALARRGIAILVGKSPWSAQAQYALADVLEVRHFLLRLAGLEVPPRIAADASG